MIDELFKHYPRQFGEKRSIAKNKDEFYGFINRFNGKIANCFTNVYDFIDENPIIDKIFLDLDNEKTCWESTKKIHNFLLNEDLRHCIMFSGGGFHVYIFTDGKHYNLKYPKTSLKKAQEYIANMCELKIGKPKVDDIDEHIIGRVQQLTRIPFTFNGKANRRRFCIPLVEGDFIYSYEEIKEIAKEQHNAHSQSKIFIFGEHLFQIERFDISPEIENIDLSVDLKDGLDFTIKDVDLKFLKGKIPPLIIRMLQEKKCGWKERYYQILAFREAGFPMPLCIEYCKKHWLPEKFRHCMYDEHDFNNVYSNPKVFFPTWGFLKAHGYPVTNEDVKFKFYKE